MYVCMYVCMYVLGTDIVIVVIVDSVCVAQCRHRSFCPCYVIRFLQVCKCNRYTVLSHQCFIQELSQCKHLIACTSFLVYISFSSITCLFCRQRFFPATTEGLAKYFLDIYIYIYIYIYYLQYSKLTTD
jgi:hypothetical protein